MAASQGPASGSNSQGLCGKRNNGIKMPNRNMTYFMAGVFSKVDYFRVIYFTCRSPFEFERYISRFPFPKLPKYHVTILGKNHRKQGRLLASLNKR
jgi:hypothetical protein